MISIKSVRVSAAKLWPKTADNDRETEDDVCDEDEDDVCDEDEDEDEDNICDEDEDADNVCDEDEHGKDGDEDDDEDKGTNGTDGTDGNNNPGVKPQHRYGPVDGHAIHLWMLSGSSSSISYWKSPCVFMYLYHPVTNCLVISKLNTCRVWETRKTMFGSVGGSCSTRANSRR